METLGNRIKELRLDKGLTQADVAKVMHVAFGTISNWERGVRTPSLEELGELANFFAVTTDYLLGRTNIY